MAAAGKVILEELGAEPQQIQWSSPDEESNGQENGK